MKLSKLFLAAALFTLVGCDSVSDVTSKGSNLISKYVKPFAKSKASEVPVALASYKTIQDAYFSEVGQLGSFSQIGYTTPLTSNFIYDEMENGLRAVSLVDLGGCRAGSSWGIFAKHDPVTGKVSYVCYIRGPKADPCAELTPSFGKLCE